MKDSLIAGVVAVGGSFLVRIVQLAAAEVHALAWWVMEAGRWSLVLGASYIFAMAVWKLQEQVQDHEQRLTEIATEAMWARLELDVVDLNEYAEDV